MSALLDVLGALCELAADVWEAWRDRKKPPEKKSDSEVLT